MQTHHANPKNTQQESKGELEDEKSERDKRWDAEADYNSRVIRDQGDDVSFAQVAHLRHNLQEIQVYTASTISHFHC